MSDVANGVRVADIIRTAGGQIVGRTRLQKVAYLLQLVGYPGKFPFEYYHYGPYSDELSSSAHVEDAFGYLTEKEAIANWGGKYSVFTVDGAPTENEFSEFARAAADSNAIELELAATAAFLAKEEHCEDPWEETARRKPEKAVDGHLENAKALYRKLAAIKTPNLLPDLQ